MLRWRERVPGATLSPGSQLARWMRIDRFEPDGARDRGRACPARDALSRDYSSKVKFAGAGGTPALGLGPVVGTSFPTTAKSRSSIQTWPAPVNRRPKAI